MNSFLNSSRPPVFCPGCSHERVTRELDKTFQNMGLSGNDVVMVSDIGCSGLFDTFFNTHALHGLHGRALTYAQGIKLARPELHVVVTMGDGGLGIGGAHFVEACRRNVNLTLLILNNFNYGMTGGQFSATTPMDAQVGSGFLNRLEPPLDAALVAAAAGAPFVVRCSAYRKELPQILEQAMRYDGFAMVETWGICPGRYTKKNKLTPAIIDERLAASPAFNGEVAANRRKEYGSGYREQIAALKPVGLPAGVASTLKPPFSGRREVVLLGSAGQRIITAGELFCMAAMTAGLKAAQKNDYNITVLRGPSVSELVITDAELGYTGVSRPTALVALAPEGVTRGRLLINALEKDALVIKAAGVELPDCRARVQEVDFKALGVKSQDWALASLAVLADLDAGITLEMLNAALSHRFRGPVLETALELVERVARTGRDGVVK